MELSDTTSIVCEGQPTQEDCTSQSMPSVAVSKRQVRERSEKFFQCNGDKNTDERQRVSEERQRNRCLPRRRCQLSVFRRCHRPMRLKGVSGLSTVTL